MNRLRIFADFATSRQAIEDFKYCWGELPDNWVFVEDDSYTHVILLNTPMPYLTVPKERVVGLALEPIIGFHPFLQITNNFLEYATNHIGRYLIGAPIHDQYGNIQSPFEPKYAYLFHMAPPPVSYIPASIQPNKPLFSIMVSHKTFAPGHNYRHILVRHLLQIPNFPMHVYGNGCEPYRNDPRVRGGFDKHQVMYNDYPFHICIENFVLPHYFSEKIINPMLCGCTPVYIGCSNIDSYFPTENGILKLTGDVNEDIRLLYKIIDDPHKYKKEHTPCRDKVREITHLPSHLDELFGCSQPNK
jgi:hypothetical protein